MTDLVQREDQNGVAILSINRPKQLNALSPKVFTELKQHIDKLETQKESIACVILRGEGGNFSSGNDLKAMQQGEFAPAQHYQAEIIDALEALPQVVIALVQGHCFTGALELVLGCDLLICSESARIADTHGKWGMSPTWGMSQRLPRRIGILKAKELMFTGRQVTGSEAVNIGLANRCLADATVLDETLAIAEEIVQNSWFTLRTYKQLIAEGNHLSLEDALQMEREKSPGMGPDMMERLSNFGKK